jgi:hypothetical protein
VRSTICNRLTLFPFSPGWGMMAGKLLEVKHRNRMAIGRRITRNN